MAKSLNFNTIKKQYMTVTLPDEKQTVLLIGTPTKALMGELDMLQTTLEAINNGDSSGVVDDLYTACAKIMSNNKVGTKITKSFLEKILDIEDITIFFFSYVEFIESLANEKN